MPSVVKSPTVKRLACPRNALLSFISNWCKLILQPPPFSQCRITGQSITIQIFWRPCCLNTHPSHHPFHPTGSICIHRRCPLAICLSKCCLFPPMPLG